MRSAADVELGGRLRAAIRDVPDFPQPGILFKDITPVLADPGLFADAVDALSQTVARERPDAIVGIEARGFIFAAPLALRLGCAFVPIRKPGKLPFDSVRESYSLEYGENILEAHIDAISHAQRVIVVDDVLATGGTAAAAGRLVERLGGHLAAFAFLLELGFLEGRARLEPYSVHALVNYAFPE